MMGKWKDQNDGKIRKMEKWKGKIGRGREGGRERRRVIRRNEGKKDY